jgi:hypothetical protein
MATFLFGIKPVTLPLRRQRTGVALVPSQQGAVYLFAGIADRAAYSEKRNAPTLPPVNDGACGNLEVHGNLTL